MISVLTPVLRSGHSQDSGGGPGSGELCPPFISAGSGGQVVVVPGSGLSGDTMATIDGIAVNCQVLNPNRALVECPALSKGNHQLKLQTGGSSNPATLQARGPGELDPVFVIDCVSAELAQLKAQNVISSGFASSVSGKLKATRDAVIRNRFKTEYNILLALDQSLEHDNSEMAVLIRSVKSNLLVPPILGAIIEPDVLHSVTSQNKQDPSKSTTKEFRDATKDGLKKKFGIDVAEALKCDVKDPSNDATKCGEIFVDHGKLNGILLDEANKFNWGCFFLISFVPLKNEPCKCAQIEFILCRTRKCDPVPTGVPNQTDDADGPTTNNIPVKKQDPSVKTQRNTEDGFCMTDTPSIVNPWTDTNLRDKKLECTWDMKAWLVCADNLPLTDAGVFGYVQFKVKITFTKVGNNKETTLANGVTVECKKEDIMWVKAAAKDIKNCLRDWPRWRPQ